MNSDPLESLVATFAENVIAQSEAIMEGDSEKGNAHHVKSRWAFDELRKRGDAGREALTRLFDHPRPDVRSDAAACLLRYCTRRAKRVLKEVAKQGPSFSAFCASECLKRWKETKDKSKWELDPE
jgi:Domain of unknown function (DUF2019)